MAGLDLSSFASLMTGGASGPVIAPGKPQRSLLWKMIETGQMPMGRKLDEADKKLLKAYIEQGRFPSQETAIEAREAAKITPAARNWWAFKPPTKPVVPTVRNQDQVRNSIDAFIIRKLEEKNWKLGAEADRRTLLRRATLDLTGLPPTAAETSAFLEDRSPNAWERVLDRLLASPHYGEHWGRHWLDVAGYSDSMGDASDLERDVSWKYRDYVIRSFNNNKPYDRFLTEQFAGDQLVNYDPSESPRPDQIEPLTATGFLRMTADISDNQTIYEVDKYFDALEKAMETSLKATIGLAIGCARCHDHKFDPILQKDYYKLTSIFQASYDPENWLAANLSYGEWPSRMVLNMERDQRQSWIKLMTSDTAITIRRERRKLAALYGEYRDAVKTGKPVGEAQRASIRQRIEANPDIDTNPSPPDSAITDPDLEQRFPELAAKKALIRQRLRDENGREINPDFIMALWDVSRTPSPTYILQRGNYLAPGAPVQPGIPSVLDDPRHPYVFPDPAQHPDWRHTGRRLALAQWLTRADNPLTSRVFVNRVWQFHFGEGIVRSVDDFGSQGARPTHPELLDYLAVSFVEHGWDVKWLQKQIMMSSVYRQSSAEDGPKLSEDPANRLLWRKAPLRLEAEALRDSMLQISGLLDKRMFGRQEPLKRAQDGQYVENERLGNPNRRSVYLSYARTRPVGFLRAFDCPDMTSDSQPERFRSALPSQSLALMNNTLTRRTSSALASQLLERNKGDVQAALVSAFPAVYSREAHPEELRMSREALAEFSDPLQGLRIVVQALMGANDFLYSF